MNIKTDVLLILNTGFLLAIFIKLYTLEGTFLWYIGGSLSILIVFVAFVYHMQYIVGGFNE